MVLLEGPITVPSLVGTDVSVYGFLLTTRWPWNSEGRKGLYLVLCGTPLKLEPVTTMQTSAAAQVAERLPTMSQALGLISSTA